MAASRTGPRPGGGGDRLAPGPPYFVVCGGCGRRLSDTVSPGEVEEVGEVVDPAREPTGSRDDLGVVLPSATARHLVSSGTDNGCCGSDGCDGPNRSCDRCGAVVGTMRDDCWTPQVMQFVASAVTVVVDLAASGVGRERTHESRTHESRSRGSRAHE